MSKARYTKADKQDTIEDILSYLPDTRIPGLDERELSKMSARALNALRDGLQLLCREIPPTNRPAQRRAVPRAFR